MKKIITGVAFFKMCDHCHAHGWIILPSDEMELPVSNKESGCNLATQMAHDGEISSEEYKVLCEQIRAADALPELGLHRYLVDVIALSVPRPKHEDNRPIGYSPN